MVITKQNNEKVSPTSRIIGSGISGGLELILFHPVDTIAKRLMSNKNPNKLPYTMNYVNEIIFQSKHKHPYTQRYLSLFPGLGFAAGYKILQRIYKFGGQPIVKDYIKKNHHHTFKKVFGDKQSNIMMEAVSGSIVGLGELVLLPLDILKIKSQTNPSALQQKMSFKLNHLYKGIGFTALRNVPGSFALFGGNQLAKTYIYPNSNNKNSFLQLCVCSMIGSVASIVVAAPMDVVKTRIQNRTDSNPKSGLRIMGEMIKHEGVSSFFKGLGPKVLVVGPKLIFSFTVAQYLINIIHETLD